MKQEIVIKVAVDCEKCMTKAKKLAASADGVEMMAIKGNDRDHLVLLGDGVDCIGSTSILRKKVGYVELVSIQEVQKNEEKSHEKEDEKQEKMADVEQDMQWNPRYIPHPQPHMFEVFHDQPHTYEVFHDPSPDTCYIQ